MIDVERFVFLVGISSEAEDAAEGIREAANEDPGLGELEDAVGIAAAEHLPNIHSAAADGEAAKLIRGDRARELQGLFPPVVLRHRLGTGDSRCEACT